MGIYFSTYYSLKQHFFEETSPGAMEAVLLGSGARTVAGVLMLPVTVIKTRFEVSRGGERGVGENNTVSFKNMKLCPVVLLIFK